MALLPSWYLGFGWLPIAVAVGSGLVINLVPSTWTWLMYAPFLGAGLHMTKRFRLYNSERWRRVHARSMQIYARLAGEAFDQARKQGQEFNLAVPCTGLARALFPNTSESDLNAMLGSERKPYFNSLLDRCAPVFVQGVEEGKPQKKLLDGIRRDIENSQLGPDAVIVRAIEHQLGPGEAAAYFQARLLGVVS